MALDEHLGPHRVRIDPVEAGVPEVRYGERAVRERVDVHREAEADADVRDVLRYRPTAGRPLQAIVSPDLADEVSLVFDQVLATGAVVEAEMDEAVAHEVARSEVHDPLDHPAGHARTMASAIKGGQGRSAGFAG
jgi:hypothetical protein